MSNYVKLKATSSVNNIVSISVSPKAVKFSKPLASVISTDEQYFDAYKDNDSNDVKLVPLAIGTVDSFMFRRSCHNAYLGSYSKELINFCRQFVPEDVRTAKFLATVDSDNNIYFNLKNFSNSSNKSNNFNKIVVDSNEK